MKMETKKAPNSGIAHQYVSYVDVLFKNAENWLNCKRSEDGAEGMWRIHDDLYDMTKFVDVHPGGKTWLTLTKGTDITEAYETHHLHIERTNRILAKYHVRKAAGPRNYKLTFAQDGFYQTLKRRVVEHLKDTSKSTKNLTNYIADGLLLAVFATSILSTYVPYVEFLAALLMTFLVITGHNYFHMRDNFRMYYFNMSLMNFADWRVSHALSHHLYTNSLVDMELLFFDPVFCWQPKSKNFVQRYVSWVYTPFVYSLFFVLESIKRYILRIAYNENILATVDLVPMTLPIAMYAFGETNLFHVLQLWLTIIVMSSFIFACIGLNAGHHHPEVFHDGDAMREDRDWGIYQIDTMFDRSDLKANHFLVVTNFGDHILHHMFPTIDHGYLKDLYEILYETMSEFNLEPRNAPWSEMIRGQHLQLARTEPSTRLRDIEEKIKSL